MKKDTKRTHRVRKTTTRKPNTKKAVSPRKPAAPPEDAERQALRAEVESAIKRASQMNVHAYQRAMASMPNPDPKANFSSDTLAARRAAWIISNLRIPPQEVYDIANTFERGMAAGIQIPSNMLMGILKLYVELRTMERDGGFALDISTVKKLCREFPHKERLAIAEHMERTVLMCVGAATPALSIKDPPVDESELPDEPPDGQQESDAVALERARAKQVDMLCQSTGLSLTAAAQFAKCAMANGSMRILCRFCPQNTKSPIARHVNGASIALTPAKDDEIDCRAGRICIRTSERVNDALIHGDSETRKLVDAVVEEAKGLQQPPPEQGEQPPPEQGEQPPPESQQG